LPWRADLAVWATGAAQVARVRIDTPGQAGQWRHGGTWCVGLNLLGNDGAGRVAGGLPLPLELPVGAAAWDGAQVSVCRPGYPGRGAGDSDSVLRYRRGRDAAHVDGLLPIGPGRRRMLREPHALVIGLPLNICGAGASPLMVWEGSVAVMRAAFAGALAGVPPSDWPMVDLTDTYHAARAACFATCPRWVVQAKPGAGYLVHRLALHGVAFGWRVPRRHPKGGWSLISARNSAIGQIGCARPDQRGVTKRSACGARHSGRPGQASAPIRRGSGAPPARPGAVSAARRGSAVHP